MVSVNTLLLINVTSDFTPAQRTSKDINPVMKIFTISKQLKGTPDILNLMLANTPEYYWLI